MKKLKTKEIVEFFSCSIVHRDDYFKFMSRVIDAGFKKSVPSKLQYTVTNWVNAPQGEKANFTFDFVQITLKEIRENNDY